MEVPSLSLAEVVSKASFKLSNLITGEHQEGGEPMGPGGPEEYDDTSMALDGEPEVHAMPTELQYLFAKSRSGPLRESLDGDPLFRALPQRAPENNHRGDGKGGQDRLLRSLQQQLLQALRL